MASGGATNRRLADRGAALIERLTGYHGDGKDVTDPRELYTILSQAEAKRFKTCVNVPLLVSEATIQHHVNHELKVKIRVEGYKPEKKYHDLSPLHHQSSLELFESANAGLPTLTLLRQSSSLEDLSTLKRKESKRTRLSNSDQNCDILPRIEQRSLKVAFAEESAGKEDQDGSSSGIVLPKVPKLLQKTLPIANPAPPPPSPQSEEEPSAADPRLTGVPDHLVGRARQILMEETFREKLRARGLGLNRNRTLFPRDNSKSLDLKAYDLYPGQYWELRRETVHQPQDLEQDMIDRHLYRLKQKSMLKLKVLDGEEKQRDRQAGEQTTPSPSHRDLHRPPVRKLHPRAPQSLPDSFATEETVDLSPVTKLMLGPVGDSRTVGQNETDSLVGPPNSIKGQRTRFPYILTNGPVLDANISHYTKYTQMLATPRPRYLPPTSVVNLTIDQPSPRQRKPRHIELSLKKQKKSLRHNDKMTGDVDENLIVKGNEAGQTEKESDTTDVVEAVQENLTSPVSPTVDHLGEEGKKKSLLTGFKKLEVFGETKPEEKGSQLTLLEDTPRYMPQCHPPLYKLDMRNYPPRGNMIEALMGPQDTMMSTNDSQAVSVHVIDGDSVLSKVHDLSEMPIRTARSDHNVGGPTAMTDTPVVSKS